MKQGNITALFDGTSFPIILRRDPASTHAFKIVGQGRLPDFDAEACRATLKDTTLMEEVEII
jgi:hypothetical protein